MPTSLNFQGDYNIPEKRIKIGAILNIAFPTFDLGLKRLHYLAILPRFETRYFEIGLPVSINQMWRPKLGTSIRLGPLTFGMDNILPIISNFKIYQIDMYFAFHYRLYYPKRCDDTPKVLNIRKCPKNSNKISKIIKDKKYYKKQNKKTKKNIKIWN